MNPEIRVRFAPSPTGPLHIGGVRTALYNYLFAKKNNGKFILRIEDTDAERTISGATEYIVESLKWCGITIDEGFSIGGPFAPYRQSERKEMYLQYAKKLIKDGNGYYAFDTPEELEQMREKLIKAKVPTPQYNSITRMTMRNSLTIPEEEVKKMIDSGTPYVIRIKIPRKDEIRIHDLIRGWVVVHSSQMDDKVLLKSDGMPTYHLANVVDDYLMKISHVIRGEEWLPSAPLHVLLYKFLGWEEFMPQFAHLSLLLRPDGQGKLSKRDGDQLGMPVFPLEWNDPAGKDKYMGFREEGYLPEAFLNFLVMLGWNPGTTQEIFSISEMVNTFSLERVHKAGAKFDPNKLLWFNQQYVRKIPNENLSEHFKSVLNEKRIFLPDNKIQKICELMKERISFTKELFYESSYFYYAPEQFEENLGKELDDNVRIFLKELKEEFTKLENFSASETEKLFKELVVKTGFKLGKLLHPFRIIITGKSKGPAMFEICEVIGREEVLKRLEKYGHGNQ